MEMSVELIKERIKKVRIERKKYLEKNLPRINVLLKPRSYCGSYSFKTHYFYSKSFIYFLKDQGFTKKQIIQLRKVCGNNKHNFIKGIKLVDLSQEEWNFVVKLIENTLKHEKEFLELKNKKKLTKNKKELCRLTKCYADLTGQNPCLKICEKCGSECQIESIFCQVCGDKFK